MFINQVQKFNYLLVVVFFAIFMTACGGGGSNNTPADDTPADDTPADETPADDTPADDTPADDTPDFAITSENYTEGGAIPLLHACENLGGTDASPQYSWSNPPTGTSSYAIIMDDETPPCGTGAEACVHWALYNLPSSTTSLVSNVDVSTIDGAVEGYTYDAATIDYAGPCPPNAHTYNTTVYALGAGMTTIGANTTWTSSTFEAEYSDSIIGQAEITGTFTP
ncbi:MAG: YbhB/YbcL family Raf kinase inhibitor-like protein [Porticoccaceae bacterium]|nr:YbhB/YbcL family Raf kinase inhibitor-like protein [Porticoccaceae bacterium]